MKIFLVLLAMSLVVIPGLAENTTLTLNSSTHDALQDAINRIGPGGRTIRMTEGTFKGTVVIDKPLNIVGAGIGRTIVDGDNKDTVFTIGKTSPDI